MLAVPAGASLTNTGSTGVGRYSVSGSAAFNIDGTFVNNSGSNFYVPSNVALTTTGIVQNNGVLDLLNGIFSGTSTFANPGTLIVDGTVDLSAATLANYSGGTLTAGTWTVNAGTLLFGSHLVTTIGSGASVVLNGSGSTFDALNALTANNGALQVASGRNFAPTGGSIANAGSILIGAGSAVTANIFGTAGSSLAGAGTVAGAISVIGGTLTAGTGGALVAGSSTNLPGTLTAGGNVTFGANSVFQVYLQGNSPGNFYSRLTLSGGALNLGAGNATLMVALSYIPNSGDEFFIVTGAGTSTGYFAGQTQGSSVNLGNGYYSTISYTGNASTMATSGGTDVVLFNPVPEPAGTLLLGGAAFGLIGMLRRRSIPKDS